MAWLVVRLARAVARQMNCRRSAELAIQTTLARWRSAPSGNPGVVANAARVGPNPYGGLPLMP